MSFLYAKIFYDREDDKKIFTPVGRIFRKLLLNEHKIELYDYMDFYTIIFNLFISAILFYVANRWYGKENVIKTIAKLITTFIIINIIIIVYTFIDNRLAIIFLYVVYFLFPMSTMLILLLPHFWLNKKITEKIFVKNPSI
jgi:predicted membrane protein